jgi:hypothetical protein
MASNIHLFGTAIKRYNEKQLLKKFLNVIKIPPFGRLDFELKLDVEFYARFLALYAIRMKRHWIEKDEDYSGNGARDYFRRCEVERIEQVDAHYRKCLRRYHEHPEICQPGFEEETNDLMKEVEKGKRKKREKKFLDLWNKCIPLSDFIGKQRINIEYMKLRRKIRYTYEKLLFKTFGSDKAKKEAKILDKGFIGESSINQRSLEDSDRRCKDLTFNHDSNVGESLVATEHDDMNSVHIGKQNV